MSTSGAVQRRNFVQLLSGNDNTQATLQEMQEEMDTDVLKTICYLPVSMGRRN